MGTSLAIAFWFFLDRKRPSAVKRPILSHSAQRVGWIFFSKIDGDDLVPVHQFPSLAFLVKLGMTLVEIASPWARS